MKSNTMKYIYSNDIDTRTNKSVHPFRVKSRCGVAFVIGVITPNLQNGSHFQCDGGFYYRFYDYGFHTNEIIITIFPIV